MVVLAKALIVAGLVFLPSGVAISLGAVHGVVLLAVGVGVTAVLLSARRRGRSRPEPLHRPHHGHRLQSALALARRHGARIFRNGERR